ncbi:MAG: hypothetical protein LAO09_14410, partial [Acidobacteriia bacterium]|nr:hypothetical protein [Terriglobia bacterium]
MGVYLRKSGNWCYEIKAKTPEGKWVTLDARYDFPEKDAATTAWIEAKGKIKHRQTHTTFLAACTARLDHLAAYTVKEDHEKYSLTVVINRGRMRRFAEWVDLAIEDIS